MNYSVFNANYPAQIVGQGSGRVGNGGRVEQRQTIER